MICHPFIHNLLSVSNWTGKPQHRAFPVVNILLAERHFNLPLSFLFAVLFPVVIGKCFRFLENLPPIIGIQGNLDHEFPADVVR